MQTITELIRQPLQPKVVDADECLAWIDQVNRYYVELDRHVADPARLADVKLTLIFWRRRVLQRLLAQQAAWAAPDTEQMSEILLALGTCLGRDHQDLARDVLPERAFARLMAQQGEPSPGFPEFDRISGPGVNLDIVANRSSRWPFEKWKKNDLFARYQFENDGVRYRGLSFRPGDVLLANVNLEGNGLYTALADPKSFCSHSAFFAILEDRGKRFPVVVETFEKGVRPVPLNVFLGPHFSSYVEVYRHNDYSTEHAAEINRSAADFISSVKGYNFDSEDPDPAYMSCTAVGRFMHKRAGLQRYRTKSNIGHPDIRTNLSKVGYTYFDFFAPVDFLLNDCFHCVGFIDNNQIDRLLVRELIDREFRKRFVERELDPGKFPFPYELNRWFLRHMHQQTVLGKLACRFEGLEHTNIPRGPDDLMAVIRLVEKQIGKAITKTKATVETVLQDYDTLDMDMLVGDPRIRQAVEQNLQLPWLSRPRQE